MQESEPINSGPDRAAEKKIERLYALIGVGFAVVLFALMFAYYCWHIK